MPRLSPIQPAFVGGEVSGRMRGRVDLDIYKYGLGRCENFEPLPQGSLRMRAGTEFVDDITDSTHYRFIKFATKDQDYVAILTNTRLRVYGSLATVPPPPGSDLVVDGDFPDATNWVLSADGIASVNAGRAYVGGRNTYVIPGDRSSLELVQGSIQSLAAMNVAVSGAYVLEVEVLSVGSMTDADGKTHSGRMVVSLLKDGTAVYSNILDAVGSYRFTIPVGVGAHKLLFESDCPHNVTVGFTKVGLTPAQAVGSTADYATAPWTDDELADVQYVNDSGQDRAIFFHPSYEPRVLALDAGGGWSFGPPGWVAKPGEWVGSAWPAAGEIHDGRLVVSGVPGWRNRVWCSKAGDIFNFTLGNNADDAIDRKVTTKGGFEWLCRSRRLLGGTDLGEHAILGSSGILQPSDFVVIEESAHGSAAVQAVRAGEHVLYISNDRSKVRSIIFDFETDGWQSDDVTFVAEHITAGGVEELHFARDPVGTIIVKLPSGTLACCTFDPKRKLTAWWKLILPGATIHTAVIIRSAVGPYLWMAVQRAAKVFMEKLPLHENGASYLDASVRATFFGEDIETDPLDAPYYWPVKPPWTVGSTFDIVVGNSPFVRPGAMGQELVFSDGGLLAIVSITDAANATVQVIAPCSPEMQDRMLMGSGAPGGFPKGGTDFVFRAPRTVHGLEHLEGEDVSIILDGAQEPSKIVVGGYITLDRPGSNVVVGLPYGAIAETLPLEGGNPAGTSQGAKVHWASITARVNNSAPPLLNGQRSGDGRPFSTPLDSPDALVTDDLSVTNLGVEEGGVITISQDLPFRTEVCGIYGQVESNKL